PDRRLSLATSLRQRARLIVPVWGERYAARFTELTLPALLAPGNVPELAASLTTEVALVTQRALFDVLRGTESFRRLEKHCEVRLIAMDDLLTHPGYYGLTITRTLFRGFTDLGPALPDTWLLFLNSDIILADGSYHSVLRRLNAHALILLGSLHSQSDAQV